MSSPTRNTPAPAVKQPQATVAMRAEITCSLLQQNVNNLIESLAVSEERRIALEHELAELKAAVNATAQDKTPAGEVKK